MKKSLIFTAIFTFFLTSGCGSAEPSTSSSESESETIVSISLDEYKESVASFNTSIYDATIVLYNLGVREFTEWDTSESISSAEPDLDNILSNSYAWLEENGGHTKEDVDTTYESLSDTYADIITSEVSGSETEMEEIETAVKDIYSAYSSLYSLTTNLSGEKDNFANTFDSNVAAVKEQNNIISLLVDEEESTVTE